MNFRNASAILFSSAFNFLLGATVRSLGTDSFLCIKAHSVHIQLVLKNEKPGLRRGSSMKD